MDHYHFPIINTINDVLPHIEGAMEFVVANRGEYTIVNYVVSTPDTFPRVNVAGGSAKMRAQRSLANAIRRECRGMIFRNDTGEIIRRPLHKFFNIGQTEETQPQNVDLSLYHIILEKLDGSMIAPFFINGKVIFGTRMGETDIAEQARKFADANPAYDAVIRHCLDMGVTPMFEWMSRQNPIVIDHPEERLTLIAARSISTGLYINDHHLQSLGTAYNIPVVQVFPVEGKTVAEICKHVSGLIGVEGIVLKYSNGHMLKQKADHYIQIHNARDKIRDERAVVEYIIDSKLDDVLALLEQADRDNLTRYEELFWHRVMKFAAVTEDVVRRNRATYYTRKDYALSDHNKNDSMFVRQATFHFWDNPDWMLSDILHYVVDKVIRPGLSTKAKFGDAKTLCFPNLVFKY